MYNKYILILSLIVMTFISIVSVNAYNISYTSTNNNIIINITPPLAANTSLYFDNDLINYKISNQLIISNLDSESNHVLTIFDNDTQSSESYIVSTGGFSYEVFLSNFGPIIVLLLMLFIVLYIPLTGYIHLLFCMLMFWQYLESETETYIMMIYILIAIIGILCEVYRQQIRRMLRL